MEMPKLRLSDGYQIPMVGFGTYRLTGPTCSRMVKEALKIGYCHIDTAFVYENQTDIAPSLSGYPREELYIVSKLWLGDHTKEQVPKGARRILDELQLDYLNLLLIHWPDRTVPIGETLEAMAKLVDQGLVRSLGVSNFTVGHLRDALETGVTFVVNQVEAHPYFYQRELFEFCKENGIAVTAYAPLAKGRAAKDPRLGEIGRQYKKSASQVALCWLLQKGLIVIPKCSSPERARENFGCFDFTLSDEDMGRIDQLNEKERMVVPTFSNFGYN